MGSGLAGSLVKHVWKSIHCYRLTAVYLVAGVVLITAQTGFMHRSPSAMQQENVDHAPLRTEVLSQFRLDVGEPPHSFFRIACITIGEWFAFLGVYWDVRRRMKEWALIRLYGGHPSFVAGLQYFALSLLGALIGGGIALVFGPSRSLDDAFWLMMATLVWGFLVSICVSTGPIAYAEFCDVVAVLRVEG